MHTQDTVLVPLRAQDGSIRAYAIIDTCDAPILGHWRWQLDADGYAYRSSRLDGNKYPVKLHRAILGLTKGDGLDGDHRDRDRLNCRRSNLRVISHGGNTQNRKSLPGSSSQYRGVVWDKNREKWQATVIVNRKCVYLGRFTDEAEAAAAARDGRLRLLPYATD